MVIITCVSNLKRVTRYVDPLAGTMYYLNHNFIRTIHILLHDSSFKITNEICFNFVNYDLVNIQISYKHHFASNNTLLDNTVSKYVWTVKGKNSEYGYHN